MSEVLKISLDVSAVPDKPAGAGRYIVELAQRLNARDDISLTVLVRKNDTQRWVAWLGRDHVVAAIPSARPLRLLFERVFLGRAIARLGADVHHGPHYTMPFLKDIPVVVTIPDTTFFDFPEFHEKVKVVFFRRAITRAAVKATRLIALSEMTARLLKLRVGVEVPVDVVHLGVDLGRFAEERADDVLRLAELGLSDGARCIVFVSTLEPRKGIVELLRAFDGLAATDDTLQLLLVGQRGWGEGLDGTLATITHSDRVRLLGYVDDATLAAVVRSASVVAYPSVAEGFGLPANEAHAASVTLVTTEGSVMEELVDGAAILAPPSNAAALEQALTLALQEATDAQAVRHAHGRAVASRYTWEACVEGHVATYRAAADSNKGRSLR